jgi:pimeloyl-ACP methyl ester carboxylesterase
LHGTISTPAWPNKPSWYLISADDKLIPAPAQRRMANRAGSMVVEVAGSHAIYVSQPNAVAELIDVAVKAAMAPAH